MSNDEKMNIYIYNVVGCLHAYGDVSGAEKWLNIIEVNLNSEEFEVFVEKTKQKLVREYQFYKAPLFADSSNNVVRSFRSAVCLYLEEEKKKTERRKQEEAEAESKSKEEAKRRELERIEAGRKSEEEAKLREQEKIVADRKAKEEARRKEQARIERENAIARIRECFEKDFLIADGLYESSFSNILSQDNYEEEKKLFVKNWFLQNSQSRSTQPDAEQIAAIASLNENVLLEARAGSGKTSVVTDRTRFLISNCHVHPDEVTLLAFNRKAAGEIAERIRKKCGLGDFKNARTFHGLARQLVEPHRMQPPKDILYDERTETVKQSNFVQELISDNKDPLFWSRIYRFFRKEMGEIKNKKGFLSEEEYLTYRRSQKELTLNGDYVKSNGEKYIGDFLFEHGVKHEYERVWFWGKRNYRPDFTIFNKSNKFSSVIEHWGIDENDSNQNVPDHWTTTWKGYKEKMEEKRRYWERKNDAVLVETSIVDLRGGRLHFENILKQKLIDVGVPLKKLDDNELYKRIKDKHVSRLSKMFLQFIQKAKKQELSPDDLVEKINKIDSANEKIKTFSKVANEVYRQYEKKLADKNAMDFDDLIKDTTRKVHKTKGNCEVGAVNLNYIKYLMVDEYQDFSLLFLRLINSIREYNPDLKVFCVGDDWQAINAFAGSDLKYFYNFEKYVGHSEHLSLLTNYRSAKSIVDISNDFMDGKGDKSRPDKSNTGNIYKCYTNKVFIEQKQGLEHEESRKFDERFHTKINGKNMDASLTVGRALKVCHSIITQKENGNKKIAIMNRKRRLNYYYDTLNKFKDKLKETCKGFPIYKNFDKNVTVGTTHSFKGLEADIVIMLFVNQGKYPLIHPDNVLYEIFGSTPADLLHEEQRLFYVGMTRAKEELYILCEEEDESDFLNNMNLQKIRIDGECRISLDGEYQVQSVDDAFDDDIPF